MDYIYLAQALIPVIIVAIAAKFIISSQDKQIATLLSLVNHQEEDIASLKATIDIYEDTIVEINSRNHPKHPLSLDDKAFANAQDQYDYQDDDSEFIMSVW